MSTKTQLCCDACGKDFTPAARLVSPRGQRAEARNAGWRLGIVIERRGEERPWERQVDLCDVCLRLAPGRLRSRILERLDGSADRRSAGAEVALVEHCVLAEVAVSPRDLEQAS